MRTRVAIACCVLALLSGPAVRTVAQSADAIDAPRISQRDFKKLIAGEALPKLAKRERAQYSVLQE